MKKRIFLLAGLFLVSSLSGCTTYVGGSDGLSSHQTPESSGERRRLVELRQLPLSVIEQHSDSPARKSMVVIRNTTNQSLDVSLSGGSRYTIHIGANGSKTQEFTPGGYTFEAQIPGFPPYAGQVTFIENTDYSWGFVYTGQ